MFTNQSEERDSYIILKYPETYKKWVEDTGKQPQKRSNDYLDGEFFQFIVTEYQKTKEYRDEFCEMIDLLVRKNMTHRNYIGYQDDVKHELYSNAISKVFKYAIDGYDSTRGTAFVFFTSAITNAFKEVLKDYYRTKKIAKKLLTTKQVDAVAYNYDNIHIADIENQIKQSLVYFEDDEVEEIKRVWNDFYTELSTKYTTKRMKILVDPNTPKFKRKYVTYDHFIPVGDSGIMIEFYDLRTTNESNGTRPSELRDRMLIARKNGYQYFGVFSDQWEIGKQILLDKLQVMKECVEFNHDQPTGRELQFDFIPTELITDENILEPIFWGLKEDRSQRVVIDQHIESYINWLDSEENPTRVYGWGRLKA